MRYNYWRLEPEKQFGWERAKEEFSQGLNALKSVETMGIGKGMMG